MIAQIALYFLAAFLIYAGVGHFRNAKFFMKIMPPWLPSHKLLVDWSGIAEIVLGVGLLIPYTRIWAAWGTIALLIVVFPVNIYMLTSGKFTRIPRWFLWLRLPLQGVLIWWAWLYTK
jgi:uncharacterized membrane protein